MARSRSNASVLRSRLFLLALASGLCPCARAASSLMPAKAAVGMPSSPAVDVVSPAVFLQDIRLSLATVRLPSSGSSVLLSAPPAAAHGLSAENLGKLVTLIARAQAAGLARPGLVPSAAPSGTVSEEHALAALGALDRVLEGVSPAQLDDPDAVGAIYGRLWDGLRNQPDAEPVRAQTRHAASALLRPRSPDAVDASGVEVPSPAPAPASARLDSPQYWDAHHADILAEAGTLRVQAAAQALLREAEIGAEAFDQELDQGKVVVVEPGLGKAEMTLVDRRRIIRVTHARTELSVMFIDADAVSPDSSHLRRLIGRQFFDAGSERKDGRRGRNTAVVWRKDGKLLSVDFHEKPGFFSRDWWKWYWRATYKTPDANDVVFGGVMSVVQGVLAAGLGAVKLAMLGTPILLAPVLFTMAFGLLIGVFVSTYKNWTYRGSKVSQFFKSALISLAFAYPVIVFTHGLGAVALTSAGLSMHGHVLSNVALNNVGKVAWQQIPAMGEKHRRFTGMVFGRLKKAAAVNQGFYMINWTLRLGDLLEIPGGKVVFLLGIPFAMILSYMYARKHGFPEADEMRRLPARLLWWRKK